ncbi:hypothetical protein [Algoriphagus sp.]|uniref:hypothetical protein n=1 Tax=Algoriphagus sp. TaxID=1872435 RepID=UPI00260AAEE9|nr:hypothetical protein [Algoriphagus sp.]
MTNYFKLPQFLFLISCFSVILFSCDRDEDSEPVEEELPPIALDCNYFSENRILENDPRRPIDYVISCYTNVQGSLRIEAGVVIAFENHAGMRVDLDNQLFEVIGTETEPVIFTGTRAQNGFWRGIYFTEAHNANNIIEHAVIEYAGSQPLKETSPIYEGALALRGVSGTPPQALTLTNVEIRQSGNHGLDFSGLETNASVSVSQVTITENNGFPVKVSANMAHIFDASSSFEGNGSDFINIVEDHYEINSTVTWADLNVPYLVDSRIHIKDGGNLTLEAGSEFYFEPEAYIQPYDGSTDGGADLSLKILGTSTEQVLLAAANGTNWGGIQFGFTQEDNQISHAIIENARGDFFAGNQTNTGAIYLHARPRLSIDNTIFRNLPNCAFYGTGSDSFDHLTTSNLAFDTVGQEYCEN